jgi:anti-sigma factor RsiW
MVRKSACTVLLRGLLWQARSKLVAVEAAAEVAVAVAVEWVVVAGLDTGYAVPPTSETLSASGFRFI